MSLTKKQLRNKIEELEGFGIARWLYNRYNKPELKKEYEKSKAYYEKQIRRLF